MPARPNRRTLPYRIGLIVNPIAGMGGPVGLKGTDGADVLAEARRRGAVANSATRARLALGELAPWRDRFALWTGSAELGEGVAAAARIPAQVIGAQSRLTGAAATIALAQDLLARKVDLILFAGGDGTARDVFSAVGRAVPILGIPTGVKMHSGVFATGPATAGRLAAGRAERGKGPCVEAEIMDIDPASVGGCPSSARLYGYALVPIEGRMRQHAKAGAPPDDEGAVMAAARAIAGEMLPNVTYVIGPGRSAKRVAEALGLSGTLLGVDLVRDGRMIGRDLSERQLKDLLGIGPIAIIVGVTGAQGYLFGRGNQQIAPDIIARAGDAIIPIAGPQKLAGLADARLLVDTGDPDVDHALSGYRRVRCGRNEWMILRVEPG